MPHQCLKCGKVFPSGSPEILKGCSDCGGKKFFYTEQPVSEDERERLIEQANKDIKVLIHEILSQSQRDKIKTYDSEGREVPGTTGEGASDWVKISPADSKAAKEVSPVGATTPTEEAKTMPKQSTVKEIIKQLREQPELGIGLPDKEAAEKADKTTAKTRPPRKVKLKLKRKPGKRKRPIRPEVIAMKEPGVYDIYLSKLLKGFPIIINRDGTYLVHLPSIFESIDKDKEKKE